MNCKHVQKLLPLYVSRDLEENYARLVTAHMQSCAECAASADEYRETRQLLQQFAPPQFGEAVYDGIRRHVLGEIGREAEATAPGLSQVLESLFPPRLRWAVAIALLLAVSVLALYVIANRRVNLISDQQQLANNGGKVDGPTSIKANEELPSASVFKNKGTHQSQRRKGTVATHDRTRPATVNSADSRSTTAETRPQRNNLAEPDAVTDSVTSGKVLRVEMQTNDPNIRIIWFTPQPTKQDSPNKFSKGT